MNFPIIILPKKDLYPAFGKANLKTKIVYIREDMIGTLAYKFLVCHETYHITSMIRNRLWGEITANCYAGIRHPIGFIIILFKSIFSIDRWKIYFKMFIK